MNPFRRITARRFPLCALILVALALFAPPSSAQINLKSGAAAGTPTNRESHVRAELIADVTAIVPGVPFRLGILYRIDPGWHIYWRNSGDAGLATGIEWKLPEGFQAGPLQWPVPERTDTAGIITYGYETEVLLYSTVTPPASGTSVPSAEPAGENRVTLRAQTDWLMCKAICIPGEASAELNLPVGESVAASGSAKLFDYFGALVPKAAAKAALPFKLSINPPTPAVTAGEEIEIQLELTAATPWSFNVSDKTELAPALFPLSGEAWESTHARLGDASPERISLVLPVIPRPGSESASTSFPFVIRLAATDGTTEEPRVFVFSDEFTVQVNGSAEAAEAAATTGAITQPPNAEADGTSSQASAPSASRGLSFLEAAPKSDHSLTYYLLLAFLGGLILNVMPCVLPVISIKVLGFVNQAGEDRRHVMRLGLAFAAGVIGSFAALGAVAIVLRGAGQSVGVGFQLQEPRFVILMAAVLVAFALSLLGVFQIELPGFAMRGLDRIAPREGLAGSFFNGVLATVLATPCVGPFMGPALGFALTQSTPVIALFFVTVGAGLAAPYLVLAARPGWTRFIPRPGRWMITFRQLMAFPLFATVIFLLWVLGAQIGNDGVLWTLLFLLSVAMGCWLIGQGADLKSARPAFAAAILIFVAGYVAFPERFLQRWQAQGPSSQIARADTPGAGMIPWEPFSVAHVESLVAANRTVFIDFTADWCVNCKFNERVALETETVRDALRRHNAVPVKADWTLRDEAIGAVLEQLGAPGVPFYVILPGGSAHTPVELPRILTPGGVVEKLEEASKATTLAAREARL